MNVPNRCTIYTKKRLNLLLSVAALKSVCMNEKLTFFLSKQGKKNIEKQQYCLARLSIAQMPPDKH